MDYRESLSYVQSAKERGAQKQGLQNITELLRRLGNPEARFPCVHVAGTNGKGSVCALLESVLRAAGLKPGLYTSPYLESFPERIRVAGSEIDTADFARIATRVRTDAEAMAAEGLGEPTFFELVTACGFLYFAEQSVDVAIIETGLGGRTDATNVVVPLLSVITAIGMDHAASLGGTLETIAAEKAGILKPGVPCVLASGNPPPVVDIMSRKAAELGCTLHNCGGMETTPLETTLSGQSFDLAGPDIFLPGLSIALLGGHQLHNAAAAVRAAAALRAHFDIPDQAIRAGLAAARWPGRMEVLRQEPPLLLDGAHNPHGAAALAACLSQLLGDRKACIVFAAMADKDAAGMAPLLATAAAQAITTQPPGHGGRMAHSAEHLAALFAAQGVPSRAISHWQDAIQAALSGGLPVVICGSLYLVGAARAWLREQRILIR